MPRTPVPVQGPSHTSQGHKLTAQCQVLITTTLWQQAYTAVCVTRAPTKKAIHIFYLSQKFRGTRKREYSFTRLTAGHTALSRDTSPRKVFGGQKSIEPTIWNNQYTI